MKDDKSVSRVERALLRMFGVPEKYFSMSFGNFEGGEEFINACKEYDNGGFVLHGTHGIGKTHLAVSILRGMLEADKLPSTRKLQKASFVTAPNLLLEIRASFKDGSTSRTEKEIVDYYSEVQFLILDDLGSEKSTEFSITTLYIIIDRRDSNMMDTVITTNLSLQEIEYKLSARIASRMAGMQNVTIKMDDYRKKR